MVRDGFCFDRGEMKKRAIEAGRLTIKPYKSKKLTVCVIECLVWAILVCAVLSGISFIIWARP